MSRVPGCLSDIPRVVRTFGKRDDGAVTIDWMVLSAVGITMAIIMMSTMHTGTAGVAVEVENVLASVDVATIGDLGTGGED